MIICCFFRLSILAVWRGGHTSYHSEQRS